MRRAAVHSAASRTNLGHSPGVFHGFPSRRCRSANRRDARGMNDWRHEFVLAARERRMGRTSELLRAVRAGDLIPVSRGVYRRASSRTTDPDRRADDDHLARVRAAQLRSSVPLTIAGMSAAAVWGLPVIGEWPQTVHVASPRAPGGRSNAHLTRSYVGAEPPITVKGGLTVTTLARTVAEVCRTESMERAVAVADAALRGADGRPTVSRADILRELDALGRAPGAARARGAGRRARRRDGRRRRLLRLDRPRPRCR